MPKKKRRHLKNYSLYLFLTSALISWIALAYIIFFIHPSIWEQIYYLPLFAIIAVALASTTAIFTTNIGVIMIIPIAVISLLITRLLSFDDWYYPVLIILITITLIYFFTVPEKDDKVDTQSSINKSEEK